MPMNIFSSRRRHSALRPSARRFKIVAALIALFVSAAAPFSAAYAFADVIGGPVAIIRKVTDFIGDQLKTAWQKAGSAALQSAARQALNKLAYDSASYIGSGGSGQKPLFITKGWGEYAKDLGDSAAGTLIESLGTWKGINLCEPNIDVKAKIGLGLTQYADPGLKKPACTFSAMKSAWKDEAQRLQDMRKEDFLSKMANMFSPTGNDLSVSLSLMTGVQETKSSKTDQAFQEAAAKKGWLDVTNIGGKLTGVPGDAEARKTATQNKLNSALGTFTGTALVDASNVFLNQLAITAFNRAMSNLANKTPDSATTDFSTIAEQFNTNSTVTGNTLKSSTLLDAETDPNTTQTDLGAVLNKVIKPQFNVKADYSVLNDLVSCPDPANPGPTNCVIDDKFRQAIEEQKTVIEAVKDGYLNKTWNLEMNGEYNQSYTLRSALILRKFRILPVGWEEAISKIDAKNKASQTIAKLTLMDMISCYDANDQYAEFSKEFIVSDQQWCRGLIDPNWVLKAPLNFCKRSGYGGQILSKDIIKGDGTNTKDDVMVTRAGDYCADEQSCIKEKGDGSCEAYGYCTDERRTWNFNTDSCEPIYNTCENYTRSDGKQFSYLENTLDNSSCDKNSAGCRPYSIGGAYDSTVDKVSWSKDNPRYFNNQVEACAATAEGCSQFIRLQDGYGHNYLPDSEATFEVNPPTGINDNAGYNSNHALKLSGAKTVNVAVGPAGFNVSGQIYTLSFYAKNCAAGDKFNLGGTWNGATGAFVGGKTKDLNNSSDWQYFSTSYTYPETIGGNEVIYTIRSSSCVIDNVKLELGNTSTLFSRYGENSLAYEKLLPAYLESSCYQDIVSDTKDYSFKSSAVAKCNQYARKCNAGEVGCDLYTSLGGVQTAAKANATDYCSEQCLGYDTYIQKETSFLAAAKANLIPATATACKAEVSGCSEFTNLDKLEKGGESKEYYSWLRQCIKDNNVGNGPGQGVCGDFYTWEGSESSGYQLKSLRLRVADASKDLYVTSADSQECSETIFNLPVSDPKYNPDCRQFYNKDGSIYYHLASRTVTCSDNCQPYRLSENNPDSTCLNGGFWDANQKACIYYAIPDEGLKCAAADNGCREYNGNQGNTTRIVSTYAFEPDITGWSGTGASASSESTSKNGHSLKIAANGSASTLIGQSVSQNGAYVIKFMAKAASNLNLTISLGSGTNLSYFGLGDNAANGLAINGKNEWYQYQVSLPSLNHAVGSGETLSFSTTGDIFIDNLVLSEVSDRYYFIKDSWKTPDVCYYDILGEYQGANYNLGCQQYQSRSGQVHNLRQFSKLCQDSSVGCELLVDTRNSTNPASQSWTGGVATSSCATGDGDNCTTVGADQFVYAVYDQKYECSNVDQGCRRIGYPVSYNPNLSVQNLYQDAYVRDNPDKYGNITCGSKAIGCDAWSYVESGKVFTAYFRDPGNQACQWRRGTDNLYNWFKKKISRCDLNKDGKITIATEDRACASDSDCSGGKCILDNNDYFCPVDKLKTIGYGGLGNNVKQPDGWAGICDKASAGCTEYIDPISVFNPNMLTNPDFQTEAVKDDWKKDGDSIYQEVLLEKSKLYIFEVKNGNSNTTTIACPGEIKPLLSDNTFGTTTKTGNYYTLSMKYAGRIIFDSLQDNDSAEGYAHCRVITRGTVTDNKGKEVILHNAIIDYKTRGEMDRTSCEGSANVDSGCILFNERRAKGFGDSLIFDAAASYGVTPNCTSGTCDSNAILKVRPNRVCDKWLACASYDTNADGSKECFGLNECNKIDSSGDCLNFVKRPETIRSFNAAIDKNASGYAKLGYSYFPNMVEDGKGLDIFSNNFEENKVHSLSFNSIDTDTPDGSKVVCSSANSVDYPAEGRCYVDPSKISGGKLVSLPFKVKTVGTDNAAVGYFVSFLMNGTLDKVVVHYYSDSAGNNPIGTDTLNGFSANLNVAKYTPSGWQRVTYRFNPPASVVSAIISIEPGGTMYVDDVNVEPVLRVNVDKTKYVAKSCRLYPKQDSLSCQSDNPSVYGNGWSGYCLETDPKNPDICLMWLPVDGISASDSGFSSATTGYHGYNGGTANPDYCAYINPLNLPKYTPPVYTRFENHQAVYRHYGSDEHCGGCGDGCDACGTRVKDAFGLSDSEYNTYMEPNRVNVNGRGEDTQINTADGKITANISGEDYYQDCDSGDCPGKVYDYYYGSYSGVCPRHYKYLIFCNKLKEDDTSCNDFYFSVQAFCVPDYTESGVVVDSTMSYVRGELYGQNINLSYPRTWSPADKQYYSLFPPGWKNYDGSDTISVDSATGCAASDQARTSNGDCFTYKEDTEFRKTTDEIMPELNSSNPNEYFICNSVRGGNAWAQRMTVDSGLNYFGSNPYGNYGLNTIKVPYGAAASADNYVGYNSGRTAGGGLPYGCIGPECTRVGVCSNDSYRYCVMYNNDFTPSEENNHGGELAAAKKSFDETQCGVGNKCNSAGLTEDSSYLTSYSRLANIFYSEANGKYNGNGAHGLPAPIPGHCTSNIRNCNSSNANSTSQCFCYNYPVIKEVSVKGQGETITPQICDANGNNCNDWTDANMNAGYGKFSIPKPGYYTLVYKLDVDPEQTPFSSAKITFGETQPNRGYFDPGTFSTTKYFSPGSYDVNIRVKDNWGYHRCFGVPESSSECSD